MKIGPFDLDKDVLVVAEIGNNHEGDYALAEEMIGLAARAGAGAVKFQTIRAEKLVSPADPDRLKTLKSFELTDEQFHGLAESAQRAGILFLSTPFDLDSVKVLEPLVPALKISSGDNTFYPLLRAVAQAGKPVLLSTGLADLKRIGYAKALIEKVWLETGREDLVPDGLVLLHCVSAYPTPPEEANLAAIPRLITEFGGTVGYSDHTLGIEAAVTSVALGARIVEKHFTIDHHHSAFRDHQLSADPAEMAEMTRRIKETCVLLGDKEGRPGPSETAAHEAVRRSIVAARDIPAGHTLVWPDLSWTRPGKGLAPGNEDLILGRRAARRIKPGEMITPDLLEES